MARHPTGARMFWMLRMFGLNRRTAEDDAAVFDRGYLVRLGSHVGEEALRELIADGLFELSDRLRRVEEAAASGDIPQIRALAHDIASVAGHLGLSQLSRLAVDLNRAAHNQPRGDARAIAAPIGRAGPPALTRLRAYLDETTGTQQNRT